MHGGCTEYNQEDNQDVPLVVASAKGISYNRLIISMKNNKTGEYVNTILRQQYQT